jgi:hypothetical protein
MTVRHTDLHSNTTDLQKLSGGVWADFPFEAIAADSSRGFFKMEDFQSCVPAAALSGGGIVIGDAGGWTAVTTASGTEMTPSTTSATGEIIVTDHTNDNDENYLGFGNITAGGVDCTVSTGKPFWFEAILKHSALTNSFAIGLFKPADIAAATLTDDTGVVKDTDYIAAGANLTDGKTSLYARTKKVSVTAVTLSTNIGSLTAATFYRLGIKYKGGVLRFYVNGLEVTSRTLVGTDITSGVQLTPMFGSINDAAGSAVTHNIDAIAWGQLY